jgi:hypothetical protein
MIPPASFIFDVNFSTSYIDTYVEGGNKYSYLFQ